PPRPIRERYETAVDALLALHALRLPDTLPVSPHVEHRIPSYDMDALLIEVELLLDWFLPRLNAAVPDAERDAFRALWRGLLQPAVDAAPARGLRGFFFPHLLFLPRRREVARLWVLAVPEPGGGAAALERR